MTKFETIFNASPVILTGGPFLERMKREFSLNIDHNQLESSELIYKYPELLESFYRQYLNIASDYDLPILVMTPTTRMSTEIQKKSKFGHLNMVSDACEFLNTIRSSYKEYSKNIFIGGSLGCKGDAYSGKAIMNMKESYEFHLDQTQKFKGENVDFLFANIMPEINEALGMAKAMSTTNLPYIISFMLRKNGCLLDGTSIADAIRIIDEHLEVKPFCYMTNCIHPTNLRLALNHPINKKRPELKRFKGIKSNASSLSPEELDNCNVLQKEDFNIMVDEMEFLHRQFNLKILGGCCGTNDVFLDKLSKKLSLYSFE